MKDEAPLTPSIRLKRAPDFTLMGYVFRDMEHARTWLSQPFVKAEDYVLEKIMVGTLRGCSRCGGTGSVQKVEPDGIVTLEEVMRA